jgi:hypothetical protein
MIEFLDEPRIMRLEDQMLMKDMAGSKRTKNFIVVRSPRTGEILWTRHNLVVNGGREFTLRKLFNIPYAGETASQLCSRKVAFFGIGSGGTPVADPFMPIAPTPADSKLNNEVAFRSATTTAPLTDTELGLYNDQRSDGTGGFLYYKKAFTDMELVLNTNTDEDYVHLTLDISDLDARGALISELGLFTAMNNSTTNTWSNYQLFTRITFQTEPMSIDTSKGLNIDYYVYA